ncbi:MAG: hypothetical protein LBP85_08145, partial [Prevotellaceae bacterium]|nr:hypothetical protein [Prevotellaceae bacterium]
MNRLNANPDYILDFDARYLPECYYIESEEKAVVYYLNYARINPRQFCEKYVKPHAPWYKGYAFD